MFKYGKKCLLITVVSLIIFMTISVLFSTTNVEAAIFGSKNYYLDIEKQNLKDIMKKYKDQYNEKNMIEASYDCKINTELKGDLFSSQPEMEVLASYLSRFEFLLKQNSNTKDLNNMYYTSLFSTNFDGKKVADIDIKSADNNTVISFPGLTDKSLLIKSSPAAMKFTQAFLGDDKAFKEVFGLSRYDFNKMMEKYLKDVIMKNVPDENVELNNKAIFQNIECSSINFSIDDRVIADIYRALAEELAEDEDYKLMLLSVSNAFWDMSNTPEIMDLRPSKEKLEEDITRQIKDMCDELNREADNIDDVQFTYTVYFRNDGHILSRQYKDMLSDAEGLVSTYTNSSGEKVFNISYSDNQQSMFELTNKYREYGEINKGSLNINLTGKQLLDAYYSYEKDAKVGNLSAFVGELEARLKLENFNDSPYERYTSSKMNNIYLNIISKRKDDNTLTGRTKITSKHNGGQVGINLYTEIKQSDKANIVKPQISTENCIEMTDIFGLMGMFEEISQNLSKKIPGLLMGTNTPESSSNGYIPYYYEESY